MLSIDLSENWDDVIIFVCGGVYELSQLQLPDAVFSRHASTQQHKQRSVKVGACLDCPTPLNL